MKKLVVALLLALPLLAFANGGAYVVPLGTTQIVVAGYVDAASLPSIPQWGVTNAFSTNVVMGTLVRLNGHPYVAQAAGYTAAPTYGNLTNVVTNLVYTLDYTNLIARQRALTTNVVTTITTNAVLNSPAAGPDVVTDGTVSWLACPTMRRTAVIVQRDSGGIATVFLAGGGRVNFTVDGSTLVVASPSSYDGNISVFASGTNVIVNTATW